LLRDFEKVPQKFAGVESVTLEGANSQVGATRKITWSNKQEVTQRLIELSDLHYRITWETIGANFATDSSAAISTVELTRITETKETLVSWR
jgi:hypothetical protein